MAKTDVVSLGFPDGSKREFKKGITALEIAKGISEGLARAVVAAKLNDNVIDLTRPIDESGSFLLLKFTDKEGRDVFNHSAAHVFAHALTRLFPKVKIAIGPAIETGFHYDFDLDEFTEADLGKIEAEMQKIVSEKIPIVRKEVSQSDALKLFKANKFKVEMIEELDDAKITVYEEGDFVDMCRGPHVPDTGYIKAFKLTKTSGAYWKGDAKNKQLKRVYGIAFPDKKDLKSYVTMLEEAEKRDHRKVGSDLDLIYFHEFAPGAPFYLKKGTIIYNILIDFIRKEYAKRGYEEVITPQMYNKKLWEISGHWDHYKENMFIINVEGQEHSLKPMNCPSHCLIFNRDTKSYRDMPIRIADFCNLHRNELSGTLSGLFRVRKFAQDDAHIFCTFEQIESEVLGVLDFIKYVWEDIFHFKLDYYLSTMPEKALGSPEMWQKAEGMLSKALAEAGIEFKIKPGEGAFYGPKIDIDIEDALGRKWQCPTCQLDFNLPERFGTLYEGQDGKKHQAVMIHRAVLGSLERFMGVMIEHYAGKFPMWLSPVQVTILPIADRHADYCKAVAKQMKEAGLRVEVDLRAESTSKKVRDAEVQRINYILVVGDKEISNKTVNVRTRDNEILGEKKVDEFLKGLLEEVEKKK